MFQESLGRMATSNPREERIQSLDLVKEVERRIEKEGKQRIAKRRSKEEAEGALRKRLPGSQLEDQGVLLTDEDEQQEEESDKEEDTKQ